MPLAWRCPFTIRSGWRSRPSCISSADHVAVPTDASNLIYVAAKKLYDICGRPLPGLKIIRKITFQWRVGWEAVRLVLWQVW